MNDLSQFHICAEMQEIDFESRKIETNEEIRFSLLNRLFQSSENGLDRQGEAQG